MHYEDEELVNIILNHYYTDIRKKESRLYGDDLAYYYMRKLSKHFNGNPPLKEQMKRAIRISSMMMHDLNSKEGYDVVSEDSIWATLKKCYEFKPEHIHDNVFIHAFYYIKEESGNTVYRVYDYDIYNKKNTIVKALDNGCKIYRRYIAMCGENGKCLGHPQESRTLVRLNYNPAYNNKRWTIYPASD